ncbi:hypothetical protein MUK42_13414 [Musa troglodytarum]|uniref:Uncharacterized protein n=1 Tax=Musa troglodytarum TaxID=320322 RepID=A0A9E7I2G0_9LILI|nr:hypothetical protein MUK42_13414 [Musa troglodytarum]
MAVSFGDEDDDAEEFDEVEHDAERWKKEAENEGFSMHDKAPILTRNAAEL